MTKFETMGYEAHANGIKDAVKDPAYGLAMLDYDEEDYDIEPEDDWNQGWLKAAFEAKAKA